MTALWVDATCRVGGRRRHVAALQMESRGAASVEGAVRAPDAAFAGSIFGPDSMQIVLYKRLIPRHRFS
jgi:hypothetical protein